MPTDYVKVFPRPKNHFARGSPLRRGSQLVVLWQRDPDGRTAQRLEAPSGGSAVHGATRHPDGSAVLSNGFIAPDIKDQTATTFEIGTRFKKGIFLGGLALYHTDVKNELLTVQVDPGPPPVTRETNGTPTKKEGIEAGLDVIVWQGDNAKDPFKAKNGCSCAASPSRSIPFAQKRSDVPSRSELPGIPRQFYRAALVYTVHERLLHASIDLQHATSTFVGLRQLTFLGASVHDLRTQDRLRFVHRTLADLPGSSQPDQQGLHRQRESPLRHDETGPDQAGRPRISAPSARATAASSASHYKF